MMAPLASTWRRLNCEVFKEAKSSQKDEVEVSSGRIRRSILLFWTGGILVDETALLIAKDRLKGAATAGAV